jgi:hypothetical protein
MDLIWFWFHADADGTPLRSGLTYNRMGSYNSGTPISPTHSIRSTRSGAGAAWAEAWIVTIADVLWRCLDGAIRGRSHRDRCLDCVTITDDTMRDLLLGSQFGVSGNQSLVTARLRIGRYCVLFSGRTYTGSRLRSRSATWKLTG